jgi:hypothetical protein
MCQFKRDVGRTCSVCLFSCSDINGLTNIHISTLNYGDAINNNVLVSTVKQFAETFYLLRLFAFYLL